MADDIIRIPSIDDGGIGGIIPARILQLIEKTTGQPTTPLFSLNLSA
jgi:patatin-like phospholipase/acyl hydrolase